MERHRFDPLSFSFGLVYALLGLFFIIPATSFDIAPMVLSVGPWLLPLAVFALGTAILVPLARPRPTAPPDDDLSREPDQGA